MIKHGIEQYLDDDLNTRGVTLTEAVDRVFNEMYDTFSNCLDVYSPNAFEGNENVVKLDDVMELLEECFKRKGGRG